MPLQFTIRECFSCFLCFVLGFVVSMLAFVGFASSEGYAALVSFNVLGLGLDGFGLGFEVLGLGSRFWRWGSMFWGWRSMASG